MDDKTKKIILFAGIGVAAVAVVVTALIIIFSMLGKPSKKASEELVRSYLKAVNDVDTDKYLKLIDTKGFIIYQEEDGAKKFDSKYKKKDKYMKDYIEDKNYDSIDDVENSLKRSFKSKYQYSSYEYSFKEIVSVEKSSKSKKIVVIKAKVKAKKKSNDTTDTKTLKLSVTKVNGKYKIVGIEME